MRCLTEPSPPSDYTSIGLLPEHIWRDVPATELATQPLNATPIGNGPLKVVRTAADHIRLEPSQFYRGPRPYLAALELRFYPDHASAFTGFVNGELEGISQIAPQDLQAAAEREDLQLFSTATSEYLSIVFNLNNPDVAFPQDAVRQALLRAGPKAADRGGRRRSGHHRTVRFCRRTGRIIPTCASMPTTALASAILDQAGWIDTDGTASAIRTSSLALLIYANDDPLRQALIERLAVTAAIGVDAQPVSVTFAGLVSDFLNPLFRCRADRLGIDRHLTHTCSGTVRRRRRSEL